MGNRYKIVEPSKFNDDEYLVRFIHGSSAAVEPGMLIKPINPDEIANPVYTDYQHYLRSLMPDDEWERVMKGTASAEITPDQLTCGDYYHLAKMIPKDYTVIDIGCAYNAQSYLFQNHKRYIGVEPAGDFDGFRFIYFQAPGTEFIVSTGQDFIHNLPDLDMDKTFAICTWVPDRECRELVRKTFNNCYVYYP